MGLDPEGPPSSLWKERAYVEVNAAVLHSYRKFRVSIVDHHTAAAGYLAFLESEHSHGRGQIFLYYIILSHAYMIFRCPWGLDSIGSANSGLYFSHLPHGDA